MSASRITIRSLGMQVSSRFGASRAAIHPAARQQIRSYAGIKDETSLGGPGGQADPFGKDKTGRQVPPKPRDNL